MSALEKIYDAANELTECSHDLANIARALHAVGLTKLADDLSDIGAAVANNSKAIRDAYGAEVAGSVRRPEQATSNMVSAALAVAQR